MDMLLLGGQHVAISLVLAMILEIHVFAGAFSMNSLEDFNGKIVCIGGAQELKTVEILMRN